MLPALISSFQSQKKTKSCIPTIMINDEAMLMGSDSREYCEQEAVFGTSTYIMLDAKTTGEAKKLYQKLSQNAQKLEMELEETFFVSSILLLSISLVLRG